jgi:hypothetical protein
MQKQQSHWPGGACVIAIPESGSVAYVKHQSLLPKLCRLNVKGIMA